MNADLPLSLQCWIFESKKKDAITLVRNMLEQCESEIFELARQRHKENFIQYGSEMYGWDSDKRFDEVLEELADAVVYLTSGPITEEV